jgi:hypothetical protein
MIAGVFILDAQGAGHRRIIASGRVEVKEKVTPWPPDHKGAGRDLFAPSIKNLL